tara:strand:- start:73 stop:414 length:342 start_codon:yes stop_codon:yes gene_type:complete
MSDLSEHARDVFAYLAAGRSPCKADEIERLTVERIADVGDGLSLEMQRELRWLLEACDMAAVIDLVTNVLGHNCGHCGELVQGLSPTQLCVRCCRAVEMDQADHERSHGPERA